MGGQMQYAAHLTKTAQLLENGFWRFRTKISPLCIKGGHCRHQATMQRGNSSLAPKANNLHNSESAISIVHRPFKKLLGKFLRRRSRPPPPHPPPPPPPRAQ